MKVRNLSMFGLAVCVALLFTGLPAATAGPKADGREPPCSSKPVPGAAPIRGCEPFFSPGGLRHKPEDALEPQRATESTSSQGSGGPDAYGYTWDDTEPFVWIDASTGTNAGLSGDDEFTGAIDIGFNFKFYENTYSQLYVTTNGLVTFDGGAYEYSNQPIPNRASPNSYIAPFWDDLCVGYGGYNTGAVYYLRGGSAPNRFIVVEWYAVSQLGSHAWKTFEVILHENGDIIMQYLSLSGYLTSATVGIEDDVGIDGLQYLYNSYGLESNKAIRFYRPGPTARVKTWPRNQGVFTSAGKSAGFNVPIRNTGELGSDTYDILASSDWAVAAYAADGTTPLTDTDSDGTVDTGPVAQGETATVVVRVTTPGMAGVGHRNTAAVTARSSLDEGKGSTSYLQTAIPAPFAQVYQDDADAAMSLYLVQPAAQVVRKATPTGYNGSDPAVAEMPDGFAYFWTDYRWTGSVGLREIEYSLLDRYGGTTHGPSKLTNHSLATLSTYDYAPAVSVAPDGRIGVVWYRYLYSSSAGAWNYNIYFAILDPSGSVIVPPTNLTSNTAWGTSWSQLNVPRYWDPRVTATTDDRFVVAWERSENQAGGWVEDLYYAIRGSDGAMVKPVTRYTFDTPGSDEGYYDPSLTRLSGDRVLFAWYRDSDDGLYYAVRDSAGSIVKADTYLGASGWGSDAVQLSTGNIVVAWSGSVRYAILDASYNLTAGPVTLINPAAVTGDAYVSVAADSDGHAVLTWMDRDSSVQHNLYYALVDGSGGILTDPMIFRSSLADDPRIFTSYTGYGNTSYSWMPPTSVDAAAAFSASLFGGPPGGSAVAGVRYTNHGATTATGVVLTATLDSELTYLSDTSGATPTVSGNDVVWSLPDLDLLTDRGFTFKVQVPSGAAIGTRYPVTVTLGSDGPEANPADNVDAAEVLAASQVYLPIVMRGD